MNKRVDFTKNGGFPATQFMTNFMQESYRSCFIAIANLIGDKVIVQGVDVVGGQVTNGWISAGGELMPFIGGLLPVGASVAINEAAASRVFDDGATHDVYFTKTATIGTPGNFLFSELKRVSAYKDLFTSLNNLITSFNTHSHSWASITGKPSNLYIAYKGTHWMGDAAGSDSVHTVTFPSQGTSDYHVMTSWVGNDGNWSLNNDIMTPSIFNKTSTSFQYGVQEVRGTLQNVRLEYIIIKSL